MARTSRNVSGCIYRNGRRWWWKVRLPGETKRTARPLIPVGGRYATTDRAVAEAIARQTYRRATNTAGKSDGPWCGSVADLVGRYVGHARTYYPPPSTEAEKIQRALAVLTDRFGTTLAEDFGPLALKTLQREMEQARRKGRDGDEPRYAMRTINARIGMIRRMFKWAAAEQLIPASTYHALLAVEGLRAARTTARRPKVIGPVDEHWVRLTMQAMPPTLAAMVELQMLTGMRSGEVCLLRPCDIDRRGKVWLYRPVTHKTAYRGHVRVVPMGPQAQAAIRQFLQDRPPQAYCFAPVEAQGQRNGQKRQHRQTKVQPSQVDRRKAEPQKTPGDRYDPRSYRRAIDYAITRARREVEGKIPDWHPHQLRHLAATRIRREAGLDAARAVLGQKSLAVADTYAEIDAALAAQTAGRLG